MSCKLLVVFGVFTGTYLGNIISFPLSGVLCQYGFDGGWPSVFYLFGKQGHTRCFGVLMDKCLSECLEPGGPNYCADSATIATLPGDLSQMIFTLS